MSSYSSDSSINPEETLFNRAATSTYVVFFWAIPIIALFVVNVLATHYIVDSPFCSDSAGWLFANFYTSLFCFGVCFGMELLDLTRKSNFCAIISWVLVIPLQIAMIFLTAFSAREEGMLCFQYEVFAHHVLVVNLTVQTMVTWFFIHGGYWDVVWSYKEYLRAQAEEE